MTQRPIIEMPKGPGWPDVRGWATIGAFGLTFYVLHMIDKNPSLLANASFMQMTGVLMGGTVILVFTNLFGGTKSGAESTARAIDALSSTPTTDGKK